MHGNVDGGRVRIIELEPTNDVVVKKDPVYEALSAVDNFRRLLHERPLYILGRSLLLEDQELYQHAVRLYNTRNQIAHEGGAPSDGNRYLPLTFEGSYTALTTAIAVIEWFGGEGNYVVSKGFVRFGGGSDLPLS